MREAEYELVPEEKLARFKGLSVRKRGRGSRRPGFWLGAPI